MLIDRAVTGDTCCSRAGRQIRRAASTNSVPRGPTDRAGLGHPVIAGTERKAGARAGLARVQDREDKALVRLFRSQPAPPPGNGNSGN